MSKVNHLVQKYKPENYKIHWSIDTDELQFKGNVKISGQKMDSGSSIALHCHEINVSKATLNGETAKVSYLKENEEVLLTSTDVIVEGECVIEIEFDGKISENMHGIYPSFYKEGGDKKVIIGTQFESHHARQAFPCIDEPAAKASFDVSISAPVNNVVLSNAKEIKKTTEGQSITVEFGQSPVMSTYLLAFVIGDIVENSSNTRRGVKVSMWTKPDIVDKTDFALDVAVKVLDYFEEYFEIEYPLEKYDNVALPSFSAGAMENWGLVTYRESGLIVDEENTSTAMKQYVANVVAHETTHQWFGNLVTMRWWTDLWLNEGFASWMPYIVLDHLFPDWNIWEQFLSEEVLHAQDLDSMQSTHAIEVAIDDPDDIRSIFDAISYAKGASVIGMLHDYLGAEVFRKGISLYLKKYAYSNTSTVDLWNTLEESSGKPVLDFMTTWTSEPGFPVVKVDRTEEGILNLSQERYMINPLARTESKSSTVWPVPIKTNDSNETMLFDLESKSYKSKIPLNAKINKDSISFYVTSYDDSTNSELASRLKSDDLGTLDRAGLVADSFRLAKGGFIDTNQSLELVNSLSGEKELSVWDVIVSEIGSIRSVMGSDVRDAMAPWQISYSKELSKSLGLESKESDSHSESLMRPMIFAMLASAKEQEFIDYSNSKLDSIKQTNPSLRGLILNTIARNGSRQEYDKIKALYLKEENPQEKPKFGQALCSFKDPELINSSLSMLQSKDVKLQDVISWCAAFFSNQEARDVSWEWIKNNWGWITETYGEDMTMITYFPKIAANGFATHEMGDDFEKFFDTIDTRGLGLSISQAVEKIRWKSEWKNRDQQRIKDFFTNL